MRVLRADHHRETIRRRTSSFVRTGVRHGALVVAAAAVLGGLASCSSCGQGGKKAEKADIALVPREADLVLAVNVARMRDTGLWRQVLEFRDQTPEAKKRHEEMVARTGLDPFKHIDSAFLAFPSNTAQTGGAGEFGAVVRGGPFDEARITPYVKELFQKEGTDLVGIDYEGRKLWTDTKNGVTFAVFLDQKTLLLGGKEWIKRMVDLATGKGGEQAQSAAQNEPLVALMKKTRTQDAVWGVGIVPESVRTKLKDDSRLAAAASMKDVYGSADFATGAALNANVDLGSDADAAALATKIIEQLAGAKANPQLLMAGMGQYLDAIKVSAKGPTFVLDVKLDQKQVDDLIGRVKGLVQSIGQAMPPP